MSALALPRLGEAANDALRYERHRPGQTTLYRLVRQHAASFIAHAEASTGSELPRFIKDGFDAFLECGILALGFLGLLPRRVWPRQAAGLQLQAPRLQPVARCAAHVADRGALGGPRHPARAGAPVGVLTAHPAARAAGGAARAGRAGAAGGGAA